MINLSTPPDKLLNELHQDRIKAKYWFVKKMGGEQKLNNLMLQLIAKSEKKKQNEISEVIEYNSPNGNRWLIFACGHYYKEAMKSSATITSFCYYETYGSIGAFVPTFSTEGEKELGCIIYTSHFFLRFCSRIKLEFRSREMVRKFIELIPDAFLQIYEENGQTKVDMRLPGSVGRGFVRDDDNRVIEIRTFLRDCELSNKQLQQTKDLRDNEELYRYEPTYVKFSRIVNSKNPDIEIANEYNNIKKKMVLNGIKEEDADGALNTIGWISLLLNQMNVEGAQDYKQWEKYGDKIGELVFNFRQQTFTYDDFFELVDSCARLFGCNNLDLYKCRELMFNFINNN